ncbi:cation:dicarboxylate symporter family transporter [Nonomuraea rhizosphaerae]|uniref:cation:dicarboxylate symporter family transporter n=1 Tax=Nonomuraea rhizosphaerae TaxID=2665663 RepID=UPI001C5CE971|nr:cation:dicarboxylase symporter family transporter [Nonomuraea rhizosphaerae]
MRDRTRYLYLAVIAAVLLGIMVGFLWPDAGQALKPLGTGFVNLIRMMISPIIFCTIVLGIGSVTRAAKVGKVGGLTIGYFLLMSTVALIIGLVVGNLIDPGSGLQLTDAAKKAAEDEAAKGAASGTSDFLLGIIPATLVSAFTEGQTLQTLLVALLVGFALQAMGPKGTPVLTAIEHIQRLVFRILGMVMWAAPVGAFGAIAAVVGATGVKALQSLAIIMAAFYVTCLLFVGLVLGPLLWAVVRIGIWPLFRYLGREFLLILSTSSSEVALPRLIAKMEHMGVSRTVAGITVPTGYSFNLDGTAIYLTMATLFIASATGAPLQFGEQIALLLFMMVASKGAAGVTGAGLATLAGGLQSHRPELVDGVGLIVGIDRFMSEARALTNFAGNAVGTLLVATWTGDLDRERAAQVLSGNAPFDEATLLDEEEDRPEPPAEEERREMSPV